MKPGIALVATLIAAVSLALPAQAAPPEGKGQGNGANNSGKSSQGNPGRSKPGNPDGSGNNGKGNSGKGNSKAGHADETRPNHSDNSNKGSRTDRDGNPRHDDHARGRYDEQGRYYDYFDDRRSRNGRVRGGDTVDNLLYAGITAALAREYALDYGLRDYSTLPPGLRKNLARGKPLPPGIAKKMTSGPLMERLPRYSGYEWQVAGTDLILISITTAVVADILYDVFE